MTLQDIIAALHGYWAQRGCLIHQPWDAEVGAGTMHPETFLRVLGREPWAARRKNIRKHAGAPAHSRGHS